MRKRAFGPVSLLYAAWAVAWLGALASGGTPERAPSWSLEAACAACFEAALPHTPDPGLRPPTWSRASALPGHRDGPAAPPRPAQRDALRAARVVGAAGLAPARTGPSALAALVAAGKADLPPPLA